MHEALDDGPPEPGRVAPQVVEGRRAHRRRVTGALQRKHEQVSGVLGAAVGGVVGDEPAERRGGELVAIGAQQIHRGAELESDRRIVGAIATQVTAGGRSAGAWLRVARRGLGSRARCAR